MDATTYLVWCLVVALAVIAAISAVLARQKERHDRRRLQALRMGEALRRYAEWVGAQRLAALFHGASTDASAALDEARQLQQAHFPDLAPGLAVLLAAHERLAVFLADQQALWLQDPQRWLASERDQQFMAIWRDHDLALRQLQATLGAMASVRRQPRRAKDAALGMNPNPNQWRPR